MNNSPIKKSYYFVGMCIAAGEQNFRILNSAERLSKIEIKSIGGQMTKN